MVQLIWTTKAVQFIFGGFLKVSVHFPSWSLTFFGQYIYAKGTAHLIFLQFLMLVVFILFSFVCFVFLGRERLERQ